MRSNDRTVKAIPHGNVNFTLTKYLSRFRPRCFLSGVYTSIAVTRSNVEFENDLFADVYESCEGLLVRHVL